MMTMGLGVVGATYTNGSKIKASDAHRDREADRGPRRHLRARRLAVQDGEGLHRGVEGRSLQGHDRRRFLARRPRSPVSDGTGQGSRRRPQGVNFITYDGGGDLLTALLGKNHLINRRGLSRSFQITNVFPRMSVAENLRISIMGRHGHRLTLFRPIAGLGAVNDEVAEYLEKLRLTRRRDNLAGDLAYSEQRILEMGMALATDPAVLILDEPTAGMSRDETTYIVDLIRRVTEGRTLLVVEHDMSVVFTLCDQVSVLVYGEIIASGEPAAVRADKKVQEAYLGEEVH